MSIRWKEKASAPARQEGDTRVVTRLLLLPRCIAGEWRWLGIERIREECVVGWVDAPEILGWRGLKWQSVAWVDAETGPRFREGLMRTNVKRYGSNGLPPCPKRPPPPNPPRVFDGRNGNGYQPMTHSPESNPPGAE